MPALAPAWTGGLAQTSAAHLPLVIEQVGDYLERDGFGVNPDLLLLKLRDLRQVTLPL